MNRLYISLFFGGVLRAVVAAAALAIFAPSAGAMGGFISIYQPYCWFTTDMKAKGTLRLRDTR